MTDKEFSCYVDNRYKKIMAWYDDRAKSNKWWYRVLTGYVLIVSILISPILTLFPQVTIGAIIFDTKIVAALLSATIGLAVALLSLFRSYGNWLSYRATWDALGHEIHWYNADCGAYSNARDKKSLFVERVEALITSEGSEWLARHKGDSGPQVPKNPSEG